MFKLAWGTVHDTERRTADEAHLTFVSGLEKWNEKHQSPKGEIT